MKRRHFSVRTLGLVVALVAVDCGFLRLVLLGGASGPVTAVFLGAFATVNVLTISLARLLLDRGPMSPFRVGFLVAGIAGLSLLPSIVEASMEPLGQLVFWVGGEIPFVRDVLIQARRGKALSLPQTAALFTLFVALMNAVMTPPLLLFAFAGGAVSRLVHGGFLRFTGGRESVLPS